MKAAAKYLVTKVFDKNVYGGRLFIKYQLIKTIRYDKRRKKITN